MKHYILIGGLLFWLLSGCEKEKLPLYEASNYIQFSSSYEDSTLFSFSFYPGQTEKELSLLVEITKGNLVNPLAYTVEVDEKHTTAVKGVHFDLVNQQIFRTGRYVDTCKIVLHRTVDLVTEQKKLVLRLRSNENFLVGQAENALVIIHINDMISKPDWWVRNPIEWYYLGTYSDKKYALFIEHTGIADMTGMSGSEMRYHSLVFKRWLRVQEQAGNPVREDDSSHSLMTVPVVGE